MRNAHTISATIVLALVTGTAASSALAQPLPENNSALDQYVASLPEPGGKRPVGFETDEKAAPLSRAIRRQLASTPNGDALQRVATSVALGAPARSESDASGPRIGRGSGNVFAPVFDDDTGSPVSAVAKSTVAPLILAALALALGALLLLPRVRSHAE
ncbi:MAG TPA: hypothetical protein VD790_01145 [Thermoleophilaceae bacterium]|nr:hypothetical protein [Thermoleophilaceae bacterium]